jgi:hypothetical protein
MVPTKGQNKVACSWGFMFAAVAIGLERVHAIINLDNFCQDGIATTQLFAAGPFHTCSAVGKQRYAAVSPLH